MSAIHLPHPWALLRYALLLVLLGILAIIATPADAQTLLFTLESPNPDAAAFGYSLAMGDVNGDGKADIVVGAPETWVGWNSGEGEVNVFSGSDGSRLFTFQSLFRLSNNNYGLALAVGDIDGDGKADIAVGSPFEVFWDWPGRGRVYVYSGATGSLLFMLNSPAQDVVARFGSSLAIADVNGDGNNEIIVGAPWENLEPRIDGYQGRAYVFSRDGSLSLTLIAPEPQERAHFGWSIAAGDVNGDGNAEIAVGAPLEDVAGEGGQGRVYLFSGDGGSLLKTLDSPDPQAAANFGWSLATGDTNGDGKAEAVVGSPLQDIGDTIDQGRAYVFSGPDGSLLFRLDTPIPALGGEFASCMTVGNVNNDPVEEIAVGAPKEQVGSNPAQGRAYVFSGAGTLIHTLDSASPQSDGRFGGYSVAIGDVDGDGEGDVAVGAYSESIGDNADRGRAYVFSLVPAKPTPTATSTHTPTPIPTATPTPRPTAHGVGGAVLLPPAAVTARSSGTSGGSGDKVLMWGALAAVAGAVAMSGWYATRRRPR